MLVRLWKLKLKLLPLHQVVASGRCGLDARGLGVPVLVVEKLAGPSVVGLLPEPSHCVSKCFCDGKAACTVNVLWTVSASVKVSW